MSEKGICFWTLDDMYGYYQTDCDNAFTLETGTPDDNNMMYCPYCGRNLVEITAEGADRDG